MNYWLFGTTEYVDRSDSLNYGTHKQKEVSDFNLRHSGFSNRVGSNLTTLESIVTFWIRFPVSHTLRENDWDFSSPCTAFILVRCPLRNAEAHLLNL